MIHATLRRLSITTKSTEKVAILRAVSNDAFVKDIIKTALDPFTTFGSLPSQSKAPDPDPWLDEKFAQDAPEFYGLLDRLKTRAVTGNNAKKAIGAMMKKPHIAPILWRVLKKDLRCGVSHSTVEKVWPGLVPRFSCALAKDDADAITFPSIAEPKADGLRMLGIKKAGVVSLYTRNGKPLNIPHIEDALRSLQSIDNVVFDGEGLASNFEASVSLARGSKKDKSDLQYMIFDCLDLSEFEAGEGEYSARTRRAWLDDALKYEIKDTPSARKALSVLPWEEVHNHDELDTWMATCLKVGWEGLIVKDPDEPYSFGRNRSWIKMKETQTYDCEIVGAFEGTGKYRGMLGGFYILHEGHECKVGSGFSDVQRQKFWDADMVGTIIEVKAQGTGRHGALRFPRFTGRIRDDK